MDPTLTVLLYSALAAGAAPFGAVPLLFRRPLPSTNLRFSPLIMWDGREPSLQSQANAATVGHAQASAPLTDAQRHRIVNVGEAAVEVQNAQQGADVADARLDV